jgi:hypothetical protein
MTKPKYSTLIQGIADVLLLCGLIVAAGAPLILAIEVFEWVTTHEWPGLTVADGLSLFGIEHETPENEAQRLIDLLMAIPLVIALFLTGISAFMIGIKFGDWGFDRDFTSEYLSDD